MEHSLDAACDRRDPVLVAAPSAVNVALRYFDATVEGFENLPSTGPFLVVGNHSGGIFARLLGVPPALGRRRGPAAPLYSLGFDFLFSIPGAGRSPAVSAVPANRSLARALLQRPAGHRVPGRRRRRLPALDRTSPSTCAAAPVSYGSLCASRCRLCRSSRTAVTTRSSSSSRRRDRAGSASTDCASACSPSCWAGRYRPAPADLAAASESHGACREPIDWTHLGPGAADDPVIVRHCYEQTLGRMQSNMDELVAARPAPDRTRVATPFALDRILGSRHQR